MKENKPKIETVDAYGILFLFFAGLFFFLITIKFWPILFGDAKLISDSPLQDYGAMMSGLAGFFMTGAGVIYLVKTIKVTQLEMEKTSSLMSTQLAESTFFKLLDNHTRTFAGERLNLVNEVNEIKRLFLFYHIAMTTKTFSDQGIINHTPEGVYNHPNLKNAKDIGRSIIHIAALIEEQFDESKKNFYHNTLNNNLNASEKFIAGMVITHKLDFHVQPQYSFDYPKPYYPETHYFKSKAALQFPNIIVKSPRYKVYLPDLRNDSFNQSILTSEAPINFEEYDNAAELVSINYLLRNQQGTDLTQQLTHNVINHRTNFAFLLDIPNLEDLVNPNSYTKLVWSMNYKYQHETYKVKMTAINLTAFPIDRSTVDTGGVTEQFFRDTIDRFDTSTFLLLDINTPTIRQ